MRFIYTKTFGIFSVCVIAAALLVFLQVRGWLYPIKNLFLQFPRPIIYAAKGVTMPVKSFFSTIYQLRSISRENAELTGKVYRLQQDLVLLDQETKENQALRKELGFAESSKQQLIPCTVLAKNPYGLTEAMVLNCGAQAGVEEGRAIISQGYLVGKIIFVDQKTSTALLATNAGFSTDARLSKTGVGAVARGSYGSGMILDQLPQNSQVEKGWLVTTAGISDKIPKNILIGEIGDVLTTPNDLFKKITLLNPINLDGLEFVFVIK